MNRDGEWMEMSEDEDEDEDGWGEWIGMPKTNKQTNRMLAGLGSVTSEQTNKQSRCRINCLLSCGSRVVVFPCNSADRQRDRQAHTRSTCIIFPHPASWIGVISHLPPVHPIYPSASYLIQSQVTQTFNLFSTHSFRFFNWLSPFCLFIHLDLHSLADSSGEGSKEKTESASQSASSEHYKAPRSVVSSILWSANSVMYGGASQLHKAPPFHDTKSFKIVQLHTYQDW